MRIILPFMALATVALVACNGPIPTPDTLNLPDPSTIIMAAPTAMDNKELCAYAAEIDVALASWEKYVNTYVTAFGKEPVAFLELAKEYKILDNLLEARNLTCVIEEE